MEREVETITLTLLLSSGNDTHKPMGKLLISSPCLYLLHNLFTATDWVTKYKHQNNQGKGVEQTWRNMAHMERNAVSWVLVQGSRRWGWKWKVYVLPNHFHHKKGESATYTSGLQLLEMNCWWLANSKLESQSEKKENQRGDEVVLFHL